MRKKRLNEEELIYVILHDWQDETGFGSSAMTAFRNELDADRYLLLLAKVDAKISYDPETKQQYRVQKVRIN